MQTSNTRAASRFTSAALVGQRNTRMTQVLRQPAVTVN